MCGIAGFVTAGGAADGGVLQQMLARIAHRGPDGQGVFVEGRAALGHRRLAIIDLDGGPQPMFNEDGHLAVVFNGEIYNYSALTEELTAAGHTFATHSDTEVLLHGWEQWGKALPGKLRGMFAFVVYDTKTNVMYGARDIFGVKPFYYTQTDAGELLFGSEIKSLLEHPGFRREVNPEALRPYLTFQYSAMNETFFKGIFKLPPAHCMTVRADGSLEMRRYWRPEYAFDEGRSREDTVEAIDAAMRESVRYHNVADVEVGSFLSSGIDSSYMAACLAKENPAIKTFTVGFAEYEGEQVSGQPGGRFRLNRDPKQFASVQAYLRRQGRFRALSDDEAAAVEQGRDAKWEVMRREWRG